MPTTPCPDSDQLLGYLLGKLPDDTSERIAVHLDQCPACEAAAETLDQVSDTFVSALERPVVPNRFGNEPQFQQALRRVIDQAGRESACSGDRDSSAESTPALTPAPLQPLGEYELIEKVGEGGMGAVYKARQRNLDRLVALKVLPKGRTDSQAAIGRFYREMRAVGRLNHPNIVAAHDAREIDGSPVLAMEYVDGLDLAKLVSATGPLRIDDACELVRQTAVGLQHAHEQGLVHRDIKPSNLMLNRQGTVKILDLGLALLGVNPPNHPEMTAAGTAMGTADYVSPEQVTDSHSVDVRSDIYSLGCTLYKLLSGQAPFVGPGFKNDVTKMMAHVDKAPPPISLLRTDLPPDLAEVIERMMAKKPKDRYATPGEVAAALEPFSAGCDLGRLLNEANGRLGLPTVEMPSAASTGKLNASADSDTAPPLAATGREAAQPPSPLAPVLREEGRNGRWRTGTIVAVALGLAGAILLGVVLLRIKTPAGTIVIETDQLEIAGAVVEVDGQQRVTIDPGKGLEKVTVAADEQEHVLKVVKGGFETYTKKFTVKAGKDQTITVRLEPLASPPLQPKESGGEGPTQTAVAKSTPAASREKTPAMTPATTVQPPAKTATTARSELPHALRNGDLAGDAAWTPGPFYNVLPGFIQRPAKLPGIKRWQVISAAPRDQVLSIDWSAAGLIARVSSSFDVRRYDAATLELKAVIWAEQLGGARHVRWSPDGKRLATAGIYQGRWDVLHFWRPDGSLERISDRVCNPSARFSWSADGQRIACADSDDPKQVRIVNLDGKPGPVFKGHEDGVTAVAWSPAGKQLVSSSRDKTVRIWNLDGTSGPVLKGHEINVNDVDWSPDGKWIVSASEGDVRLWKPDGTAGPVIPVANIQHIRWHPDSRRFVFGSGNTDRIGIHDLESQETTQFRDIPFMGGPVSWSCDGKQVVAGDIGGNIFVWDDKGRRLRSLSGGSRAPVMVAWSSAGQLASRTGDDGTLAFWGEDGQLMRTVKDSTGVGLDMRWSPDGQALLSASAPTMQLWNADGTRGKTVHPGGDYVAWRPDGKQFAALTGSEIRIWDADPKERKSWNHGGAHYTGGFDGNSLDWSADGQWLAHGAGIGAGGGQSYGSRLWNIDGTPGPSLDATGPVLALHPKEPLLATLYPNLRLWRIEATQQSAEPRNEPAQPSAPASSAHEAGKARLSAVWSADAVPPTWSSTPTLAWSPDGQWLAIETAPVGVDSHIRLYHLSGRRGVSIRGLGDVQSLSWSPDSHLLAMGLWDERVAVCDAQTGQAVWIGVHLPGGEAAVFSGAGKLLRGQDKLSVHDQHLAYVIEHPDGRMEVVKPSQFPARAAELARQVTPPAWAKPVPTLPDGSVDLLSLVEIKADAKPGTDWTRDGKTLVAPAGKPLPIPISLSGDYDLVVQAETPAKIEGLSLLLQADGHPFESVLCASGHISGLQSIAGQDVGQNETVLRESLLGQGQKFQLTCQVRRKQIRVLLDDRAIVEWSGESERLSVGVHWGTFAADGLLGIVAQAPYRIHELKLVPRSDTAKQSVNTIGDRAVAEKLRAMGAHTTVRQFGHERKYEPTSALPPGFLRVIEIWLPDLPSDVEMPDFVSLIASLSQLRGLGLTNANISDQGLKHLASLKGLEILELEGTLVRNPIAALPWGATHLTYLGTMDTHLTAEGLQAIGKCSALVELKMDRTELTDERLLRLDVMPKLKRLQISDNPLELSEEVIRQLVRFESLGALVISKIAATEARLMRLAEIKRLWSLDLSDTRTTDRVLEQLQTLPNLSELYIRNTPATEAGVKAMKAALPNCRVEWSPAKQP